MPARIALVTVLSILLPAGAARGIAPAEIDDSLRHIGDTTRFINDHLVGQWQDQRLRPAPWCSDLEFLRRASIDIIGRIPTAGEARAFERDRREDKRLRLIDRLLDSDEYARHWANVWTALLL